MTIKSLFALSVALTTLATPSGAAAQKLDHPWFAKADRVAQAYWGATPACATLDWHVRPHDLGIYADAQLGGCIRRIAPERLQSLKWPLFCEIAVHEYGHLLGRDHTETPAPGDPQHSMGRSPGRISGCRLPIKDGRTRSPRSRRDRDWCREHVYTCFEKYPRLFDVAY